MKQYPPPSRCFSTLFKESVRLRRVFTSILILGVSLIAVQGAQAEVINLVSGNGMAPGLDSEITFKAALTNGPFPMGPLPFAQAAMGGQAFNLGTTTGTGNNPLWKGQLNGSTAQWISTSATAGAVGAMSPTALYSQAFSVTSPINFATIDFSFLSDNDLGDVYRVGVYINGVGVPGTSRLGGSPTHYTADQSFGTIDISSGFLKSGMNTLEVYTVNQHGPSGVQWDATITVVPEPTSFALFGLALVGFARRRR